MTPTNTPFWPNKHVQAAQYVVLLRYNANVHTCFRRSGGFCIAPRGRKVFFLDFNGSRAGGGGGGGGRLFFLHERCTAGVGRGGSFCCNRNCGYWALQLSCLYLLQCKPVLKSLQKGVEHTYSFNGPTLN